ncbi:MAG: methionyl-tRNA formyltransferase [Alphaproteobacteria bacterium]|nr:methionyl-tRNA formyltransferase [Alphaproteobacteria bacterium]
MRIAFMGTPDFAVPTLDALLAAGHEVAAAYSQPPRPAGRGKALRPSPVQQRAEAAGIEVRTPLSLKGDQEQAAFRALGLDLAVVAAYGLILPQPILDAPRDGCLNVHASLLPRWRGAAPVERAILAGDHRTGVTIMRMEAGLDTGPMLLQRAIDIGAYDTAGIVSHRLAWLGAEMMVEVLARLKDFPAMPQPDSGATYASKIDKSEARIDWTAGAPGVDRQIRAFNPSPGAWFAFGGERIRVLTARLQSAHGDRTFRTSYPTEPGLVLDDQLAVGCGDGAIRPEMVQRAGRSVMTAQELLRGFPIPPGTRL